MPVPGGTTPAPKCRLSDCVAHAMLPAASTTIHCVVAALGLSAHGERPGDAALRTGIGAGVAAAWARIARIDSGEIRFSKFRRDSGESAIS